MAHRTNVVPVLEKVEAENRDEEVMDPVCGKRMRRHEARFMLFRPTATFYFCSKDCQGRFRASHKGDETHQAS